MATVEELSAGLAKQRTATHTLLPDPSVRERKYFILSVDDHFLEAPDTFTGRLPSKFADDVPRVVEQDGLEYWLFEGKLDPILGHNAIVGRPMDEWVIQPLRFDEFRPGVWKVPERVKDMDINGVYASLNFPSMVFGFAGQKFMRMQNKELGLACMRAYNDWVYEEWYQPYPDRFLPCQLTWLLDPHIAAEEIRRNAARGFTSVTFSEIPSKLGLPSIHSGYWDPFFEACVETDTAINLHVGSSSETPHPSVDSPPSTDLVLFTVNSIMTAADWVFSMVPVRYPTIKIVLSEGGAGWVPMVIDRMDDLHKEHNQPITAGHWKGTDLKPSEVLLRNFWFTSFYDPTAYANLDRIGSENILFESDYPHQDTTWPDTQECAHGQLSELRQEDIDRITHLNAAAVYGYEVPASIPGWK